MYYKLNYYKGVTMITNLKQTLPIYLWMIDKISLNYDLPFGIADRMLINRFFDSIDILKLDTISIRRHIMYNLHLHGYTSDTFDKAMVHRARWEQELYEELKDRYLKYKEKTDE
jgi:hypothetical protein